MKSFAAEFIGTFLLVFMGTASVVVNNDTSALGLVGVSVAWGLAVMALIYALGDVSGCHINPAVTLGLWVAKRCPSAKVIPYIVAQCAGALLASLAVQWVLGPHDNLGGTQPGTGIDPMNAFYLEVFLTFLLMFTVLCVNSGSREKGHLAGAVVGMVIILDVLVGGPISGASMNPARSLGPAIISRYPQQMESLWLYLTAPVAGAVLAVVCWWIVYPNHDAKTD